MGCDGWNVTRVKGGRRASAGVSLRCVPPGCILSFQGALLCSLSSSSQSPPYSPPHFSPSSHSRSPKSTLSFPSPLLTPDTSFHDYHGRCMLSATGASYLSIRLISLTTLTLFRCKAHRLRWRGQSLSLCSPPLCRKGRLRQSRSFSPFTYTTPIHNPLSRIFPRLSRSVSSSTNKVVNCMLSSTLTRQNVSR